MRRTCGRLLSVVGLASGLALVGGAGFARDSAESSKVVPTGSFSGAFLAARAAESDGDLDNAATYYQRALSFDSDNQGLQQSLLVALISEGEFDQALPYAEKLKEVPEAERFSRLALAADAMRKEEYAKAEDWLELVLESDLDRLITSVMTSWAKAGAGDIDGALENLHAIDGPEWYWLFVNYHRALINAYADRHDDADETFEAVIDNMAAGGAAPDTFMRAIEAYASYLAGRGERDRALDVLDEASEFVAGRASIAILRERIAAGRSVEAIAGSPADGASEVLLNLATALNRSGGASFVRLYLQYALALRPRNDAVLMELASVAEEQGQPEKAVALYERIRAQSPWKPIAQLQIGLNLADLERHEEAIEGLQAALERDPDEMRAYLALGGVHAAREDFDKAADVYDEAVSRIEEPRRQHWNIYYQRGIAYERQDKWQEAEPNFFQALELYPDQPKVLNYLGYSWVDMNMNLERGLELIKKAVELRPSDGYIVDSLGWAYYRLGRFEDAVRELARAVSLMPNDPVLNDHLGDAYWRVGRRLEATFQWSHARDLDPEPDVLAEVQEKLENGLPPANQVKVAETAESEENGTASDAARPAVTVEKVGTSSDDDEEGNGGAQGDDTGDTSEVPAAEGADASDETSEIPAAEDGDAGDTSEMPAAEDEEEDGGEASDEAAGEETRSSSMSPEPVRHVVRPGQTLWTIAAEVFGSGVRYEDILELNPDVRGNPDYIVPGQELRLPAGAE